MKKYSADFLVRLYKTMLTIRACEESFVEPIMKGAIRTPVHLCTGQEAVAAGVCAALSKGDSVWGNHRSHGHYLARGGNLEELVAEIYGKASGCARGRGGSMHVCDPEKGMRGAAPIVAGTISLALGCALASSIRRDGAVTVSFFGDGACGEGVLYESINFAALKRLPLIFSCENNLYSTHLPIRECRPNPVIYRTGLPFGVQSLRVDGNDVLKVYDAARRAVEACRKGRGPVFIEFMTYRMRGHVGPDDNIQGTRMDIRPPREIAVWKAKDPVARLARILLKRGIVKGPEMRAILDRTERVVREAHAAAVGNPYPAKEELTRYVYRT